ncbi:MAG TPA: hypothetical protein VGZ00_06645 [Candidatus Baltobacteraceae bacterium]|jgi:hypothetical protein|nr:hypothetical protein [Candidatus Baltobacteraceae bacterium]
MRKNARVTEPYWSIWQHWTAWIFCFGIASSLVEVGILATRVGWRNGLVVLAIVTTAWMLIAPILALIIALVVKYLSVRFLPTIFRRGLLIAAFVGVVLGVFVNFIPAPNSSTMTNQQSQSATDLIKAPCTTDNVEKRVQNVNDLSTELHNRHINWNRADALSDLLWLNDLDCLGTNDDIAKLSPETQRDYLDVLLVGHYMTAMTKMHVHKYAQARIQLDTYRAITIATRPNGAKAVPGSIFAYENRIARSVNLIDKALNKLGYRSKTPSR